MGELISVIIPVYNCEKYLKRCIESIINQSYDELEIIIIDDGSTDKSLEISNQYKKDYSNIRVYHQKNLGVSQARNKGIKFARGKYISFIDADDWIHSNFYEKIIQGFSKETIDLSVIGIKNVVDEDSITVNIRDNGEVLDKKEGLEKIFSDRNFFGFPVNKLYKTELVKKILPEPFDSKIYACEDTLFNVRYIMECRDINYNNSQLYYYYQRKDSATQTQEFSLKKLTCLDALNDINEIYTKEATESLEYLYDFYLYNYYLIQTLIKKTKTKYMLKDTNSKYYCRYLMKSKKLKKVKKLKIWIRYRFPTIFDLLRKIKGVNE